MAEQLPAHLEGWQTLLLEEGFGITLVHLSHLTFVLARLRWPEIRVHLGNIWECLEEHLQMLTVVWAGWLFDSHKGFSLPLGLCGVRWEDDLKLVHSP